MQPRLLLLQVDHVGERQDDGRLADDVLDRAGRHVVAEADVRQARQPVDQRAVGGDTLLRSGRCPLQDQGNPGAGRHVHLAADGADARDNLDQPAEFAVCGIVDQRPVHLRPVGGDEQAAALPAAPGAGLLPQLLGQEGHEGMQHGQRLMQRPQGGRAGLGEHRRIVRLQQRLGEFEIPVAIAVPDELVKFVGRLVEAVTLDGGPDSRFELRELADDPAVDPAPVGRRIEVRPIGRVVHLAKARGVPDLGREVAVAGDPALGELDVPPLHRQRRQGEAQRVGAVLVHQVDRIDHVALGLGVFLPLAVAHQPVDVDIGEGHPAAAGLVAHEMHAHHHHPGDPEEDDVLAGDQHAAGIVAREFRRLVRPAQGGEGPEGRREPGVEHVGIAVERRRFAIMGVGGGLCLRLGLLDEDFAVRAVPHRHLMAPPELARDAPGLDVAHPLEIDPGKLFRDEPGPAVLDRFDAGLRKRRCVGEPLVGEIGLQRHAGAVAVGHAVPVLLDPLDQALGFQIVHDPPARLEPVEAAVSLGRIVVDPGVGVEDVDHLQPVALADLEIVEIVGRGDLDRAAALLRVGIVVGHDRQAPPDQGQDRVPADQVAVALVLRMDGDGGVAQHGLRPGRRHDDIPALFALDRIAQMPEMAVDLALFDLEVGDRRVEFRVPVDQPLVAVDQPVLVELNEDAQHGARQALVHGEALARPVAGRAQPAQLLQDRAAGFLAPGPDLFDEGVAADCFGVAVFRRNAAVERDALLRQHPLDDHLGRDAGMVGAGLPQHVAALHPVKPDQDVLDRVVEGVADMEAAGDVRRRDHDGVGLAAGRRIGPESARRFPASVLPALHRLGPVGLVQHDALRRRFFSCAAQYPRAVRRVNGSVVASARRGQFPQRSRTQRAARSGPTSAWRIRVSNWAVSARTCSVRLITR